MGDFDKKQRTHFLVFAKIIKKIELWMKKKVILPNFHPFLLKNNLTYMGFILI